MLNEMEFHEIKIDEKIGLIIKSIQKYHIFEAVEFSKNIREKMSGYKDISFISIDLSGDISVTSRCVELIINDFNGTGSPIFFLNLARTSVDGHILPILSEAGIKADISDTDASNGEDYY